MSTKAKCYNATFSHFIGNSSWTSPEYTISNFTGSGSNGDYYCKPDYDDPILDDWSKPITLSVLGNQ